MNKTKKIALIAAAPFLALLLSGCGTATKDTTPPMPPTTQGTPVSGSIPEAQLTQPSTANQSGAEAAAATQKSTLPPLPSDDKAAVDTEINNIDKELKTTDTALNQDDLSDTQLGL